VLRYTLTITSGSNHHHFAVTNRCGHHIRLLSFAITCPLITTTLKITLRCNYGHKKLSVTLGTNPEIRGQAFCIRGFMLYQPTKLNPPLSQSFMADFFYQKHLEEHVQYNNTELKRAHTVCHNKHVIRQLSHPW